MKLLWHGYGLMGNTNLCCPIPCHVSQGIPRGMTFLCTSLQISLSVNVANNTLITTNATSSQRCVAQARARNAVHSFFRSKTIPSTFLESRQRRNQWNRPGEAPCKDRRCAGTSAARGFAGPCRASSWRAPWRELLAKRVWGSSRVLKQNTLRVKNALTQWAFLWRQQNCAWKV